MKAYKIRLYPSKEQERLINISIDCARFIYNQMLNERKEVFEYYRNDRGKLKGYKYGTEKEYKELFPFLKEASSRALQQARGDLDQAYLNFFRGLKTGKKNGFPKFKSKHRSKWSYREPQFYVPYSNERKPVIEIKGSKIKLNKVGWIKFRGLAKKFSGDIKSVTIVKHRDMTYGAVILVDKKYDIKIRASNNIVGLDLGLKEFIVCSDGKITHGIKEELYNIEKDIKLLQKYFARKQKGSNRREKCRIKLAKLYQYKTNVQNHFFWNLANHLCNENQVIGIEDLNIMGMVKNKHLSHSITYSGWGKFISMLEQKALEYGTVVYKVDRFFPSSKTCSNCGGKKTTLSLGERIYKCDYCGLEIDRDLNAAINIRNQSIKELRLDLYISNETSLEHNDYRRGGIEVNSVEAFMVKSESLNQSYIIVDGG
jgi:putative transposase